MITKETKILNKFGLHNLAVIKLVETSLNFKSEINIKHGEHIANAKSIIEVLSLTSSSNISLDSILSITVNGEDEQESMSKIIELIENRFFEAEFPTGKSLKAKS